MMNIYDYVKKYGEFTFDEKPFNEIDNLVFSELSYLDYTDTSINIRKHTIEYIGLEYLKLNDFKDIKKLGIAQREAYLLLEEVIKVKRYKNIIMYDYVYSTNVNKQFSAVMFKINDNLEYMCFEGTDELISGWKEDLYLTCIFPIPSQRDAIKYANEHIKLFGPNIIIGGHSKGGNLALVSSMYVAQYKQFKIKKVYNNDGPGLRENELKLYKYRKIKRKYIHIIPDYSMIGILLNDEKYTVIKSSKKNILAHAIANWMIEEDRLVLSTLSEKSLLLDNNINNWIKNHSESEMDRTITEIFKAVEDSGIIKIQDVSDIHKLIKLVENIRNIDKDAIHIVKSLIIENFIKIKRD